MALYSVFAEPSYGLPTHLTSINEYDPVSQRVQVAGYSHKASRQTGDAFLWERISTIGSPLINIIQLSSSYDSMALGLNSVFPSHVVGWSKQSVNSPRKPTKWEQNRTTLLGTLGGNCGEARDVNDNGDVVGWAEDVNGQKRAFLWAKGANPQMVDLGTLGGTESEAFAINNLNQVVGYSLDANGNKHAFLWTPGGNDGVPTNRQMKDLHLPPFSESVALDINDKGKVVGSLHGPLLQGFYWSATTGSVQLGNLGYAAEAQGININDQIVGYSRSSASGIPHAVLWSNFIISDLNLYIPTTSGYTVNDAIAINSRGHIACTGYAGTSANLYGLILSPRPTYYSPYKRNASPVKLGVYDKQAKVIGELASDGSGIIITPGRIAKVKPPKPIELVELTDANLLLTLAEHTRYIKNKSLRRKVQRFLSKLPVTQVRGITE